jgi:HSP20 family protein
MVWNSWMQPFAWNPWQGFEHFDPRARALGAAEVPVRVHASEDVLVVLVQLPGRDPANVELSVSGRKLVLRGKTPAEGDPSDAPRSLAERMRFALTDFERSFELPWDVDGDAVRATFTNGILRIELARVERERARRIPIQAA